MKHKSRGKSAARKKRNKPAARNKGNRSAARKKGAGARHGRVASRVTAAAVAVGVIGAAAFVFYLNRPDTSSAPEPEPALAGTEKEPGAEGAEGSTQAAEPPAPPSSAAEPIDTSAARPLGPPETPLKLVEALTRFDPPGDPLSGEQARTWKEYHRQLTDQGATAVPAIREYLNKGEDHAFDLGDAEKTGYSSVREAFFDALQQIGGPEAISAAFEAMEKTFDPWEVAFLTRSLDKMAPEQFRQKAIVAARETLDLAKAGNLPDHDIAPLFEVFSTYGGLDVVPVLEEASQQWMYYATTALARLPDGAGIPSLVDMARKGRGAALQMLAQVAPRYSEARDALLQLAGSDGIPASQWPYLAPALAGQEVFFTESVLGDGENLPSGINLSQAHMNSGNQNLYRTPGTSGLTPESLNQRVEFVDLMLGVASDPAAVKTLEGARERLVKRLAAVSSPEGESSLTRRQIPPPGRRLHTAKRALPGSRQEVIAASEKPATPEGPQTPSGALKGDAESKEIITASGKPATPEGTQAPSGALDWDAERKEITAEPGAQEVIIKYSFTNVSDSDVEIKLVRPSCGCTTLELPELPWKIAAGESGEIAAKIDLRGKHGILTKSITVDSSAGFDSLLKVDIPANLPSESVDGEEIDPDRLANMKLAAVDRQIVFKDENCAECHADPARGKMGEDLYRAACAICHDTPHRATMVPDLAALKFPTNNRYWQFWIANGRPGTLMPAFAEIHDGPLTPEQIDSLADYLTESISKNWKQPPEPEDSPDKSQSP